MSSRKAVTIASLPLLDLRSPAEIEAFAAAMRKQAARDFDRAIAAEWAHRARRSSESAAADFAHGPSTPFFLRRQAQ